MTRVFWLLSLGFKHDYFISYRTNISTVQLNCHPSSLSAVFFYHEHHRFLSLLIMAKQVGILKFRNKSHLCTLNFTCTFLSAGLVSQRSPVKVGGDPQDSHNQGCCPAWESVLPHLSPHLCCLNQEM